MAGVAGVAPAGGVTGAPMMIGAAADVGGAKAFVAAGFGFAGAAFREPDGPLPEVRTSEAARTTPMVATAAMMMSRSRLMDPRVVLRYPVRSTDSGC